MNTLQQVMFIIACAATSILVIQIILMIIGGVADNGGEIGGGASDALDMDTPDGAFDGGLDVDVPDVPDADIDIDIGGDVEIDMPAQPSMADFDEPTGVIGVRGGIKDGGLNDVPGKVHRGTLLPFGLRLLSLRSILAFIAVGAWVCYTMCYAAEPHVAVLVAVASGMAAACGMAAALLGMERLQSSGNIDPNNTVGKVGTVYLTVPPKRSGHGKINVLVQERYAEYEAVTDSSDPIPTGTEIKVKAHVGANLLLVEKYRKPGITIEKK